MRREEDVRGEKVFVFPAVAKLVGAELAGGPEDVPNTDRGREVLVDLLDDVRVLNDELEGDDVAGGVDTFVGTSAADEGRLQFFIISLSTLVVIRRWMRTFFGSSEFALEIAPALTKASKRSPSIVLWGGLSCMPLYPDPQ